MAPIMADCSEFPWEDYKTYADVGTAQGDLAAQIALANPHLIGGWLRPCRGRTRVRGICRDERRQRIAAFVPGSFFEQPLPKADVIMMGHILHDWDLTTRDADPQGLRSAALGRRADRL